MGLGADQRGAATLETAERSGRRALGESRERRLAGLVLRAPGAAPGACPRGTTAAERMDTPCTEGGPRIRRRCGYLELDRFPFDRVRKTCRSMRTAVRLLSLRTT